MKTTPFFFSLKVWLTSLLIAPCISFFLLFLDEHMSCREGLDTILGFPGYFLFSVLFGGLFSLPSYLCLFVLALYLNIKYWSVKLKRVILVLAGIAFTLIPFNVLWGGDFYSNSRMALMIGIPYLSIILIGLIFYRMPLPED